MAENRIRLIWGKRKPGVICEKSPLPLPRQKKLLKLALRPLNPRRGLEYRNPKFVLYIIQNQSIGVAIMVEGCRFLRLEHTSTDFEFNSPILKKGPLILKDFEGF